MSKKLLGSLTVHTKWTHQMLCVFPWDILSDLYCSYVQLLLVCGSLHSFLYLITEKACSVGLRSCDLTWSLKNIPFLCSEKLLGYFAVCFVSSSIRTAKHCLISLWAESVALYTVKYTLLLLSAVTWSLNTSSHTCPFHNATSTLFDRLCGVLWIMFLSSSILISSHHSSKS